MSDQADGLAYRAQLGQLRGAARELTRGPTNSSEVQDLTTLTRLAGPERCGVCLLCVTGRRRKRGITGDTAAQRAEAR